MKVLKVVCVIKPSSFEFDSWRSENVLIEDLRGFEVAVSWWGVLVKEISTKQNEINFALISMGKTLIKREERVISDDWISFFVA